MIIKGNAQFVQKVTFEPWISNKTVMEVGNIIKAATFKSFLHLTYKYKQLFFLTVLFDNFMIQTLTDHFWGLHKNMNCPFPLKMKLWSISTPSKVTDYFVPICV